MWYILVYKCVVSRVHYLQDLFQGISVCSTIGLIKKTYEIHVTTKCECKCELCLFVIT